MHETKIQIQSRAWLNFENAARSNIFSVLMSSSFPIVFCRFLHCSWGQTKITNIDFTGISITIALDTL